jgi:hypothetical protein
MSFVKGGYMGKNAGIHPATGQILEGREGIEARRAFILECRLRGLKIEAIAKLLNVHRNTVTNDIKAIAKRQAEVVQDLDPNASIGELLDFLDHARNEAMMAYKSCETDTGRVAFLQAALRAQDLKAKTLFESGIIPRATRDDKEKGLVVDGQELNEKSLEKMTNADLEAYRKKLAEQIAKDTKVQSSGPR